MNPKPETQSPNKDYAQRSTGGDEHGERDGAPGFYMKCFSIEKIPGNNVHYTA
jgi:hypothetical protein